MTDFKKNKNLIVTTEYLQTTALKYSNLRYFGELNWFDFASLKLPQVL